VSGRAGLAVVSLALALVVSVCGGGENGRGAAAFEGVPLVLSASSPGFVAHAFGWEEAPPSATFEDGTVSGSTGCNAFTATYTARGESLDLGEVVSTRVACVAPRDETERTFVAALELVAAWRMDESALALLDANGRQLLRFTSPTILGDWVVTALRRGEAMSSPIWGTRITASFADDGTLSGFGGCNDYRTTYTAERGEVEIVPPVGTLKACAEPAGVTEQEAAYFAALPTAVRYRIHSRSLQLLRDDESVVVTYARPE
jgi:heat shock protein HslJ